MSTKLLIFDLDGTLVDSSHNISNAINHVRKDAGLPNLSTSFIVTNINRDDINPAKVFYETESFTPRQRNIFETFYLDVCTDNLNAYENIPNILESFKSYGFSLSIATNGSTMFANKMIHYLGLDMFFDYIIGADLVEKPKPHPQMLELITSNYSISSSVNTPFMVGDSIKDIKSANLAGLRSAFAKWGFTDNIHGASIDLEYTSELEKLLTFFTE